MLYLNYKCFAWDDDHRESELGLMLFNLVNFNNLSQLIQDPTHVMDHCVSLLDIIITDSPGYILNSGLFAPVGDPYHAAIFCEFKIQYTNETAYCREILDYETCKWEALKDAIRNAPWAVMDIFDTVNESQQYFTSLFIDICKEHIPHRSIKVTPRDKPWMTSVVKEAIKKRDRLYKRWRKNMSVTNREKYRVARHNVNFVKMVAKKRYEERISNKLSDPTTTAKKYWHLTKQIYGNKVKCGIPSIIDGEDVYATSEAKANLFNEHFASKSHLPDELPKIPPFYYVTDCRLSEIRCTEQEVKKILIGLNAAKANGPDNVSNRTLKMLANDIAAPMSTLCNKSFANCKYPDDWKQANITPVHKSKHKQIKTNYRPISLLSNIGKIPEQIVLYTCSNIVLITIF